MRLQTAVAALGVLALAAWASPFVVDDAFIVARYAENLVAGDGWGMNAGVPSDGVTGPAWLLPMALAVLAGVSPVFVAKLLGALSGAAAAALVVRRARGRCGGRYEAWVVASLLVVAPQYAIWCSAGLETGAAALAATTAALAATARRGPGAKSLGLSVALLAWLRPDLAFFAAALVAGAVLRDRRRGLVAGVLGLVGAVSLVAFRLAYFGDALPLSFHAKPGDPSLGLGYVLRGALVITGGGGAVLAGMAVRRAWGGPGQALGDDAALGLGRPGRRGGRGVLMVSAALGAHLVAVALAGGDWMPGFRLLAPVVPTYALVAAAGFAPRRGQSRLGQGAALLCLGLALVVPALDAFVQLPLAREAGRVRDEVGRGLAEDLSGLGGSVALVDVGYLAYASGLEVVDLGGVTDPVVARSRGGHLDKLIDVGYLAQRDPDLVVLHSSAPPETTADGVVALRGAFPVEYRIAASPWLRTTYRVHRVVPYGAAYHYVIMVRR